MRQQLENWIEHAMACDVRPARMRIRNRQADAFLDALKWYTRDGDVDRMLADVMAARVGLRKFPVFCGVMYGVKIEITP